MDSTRTLTVYSTSGLANRLRVLLSGLALAEASGRTFRMLWPRTAVCGAAFGELFVNAWPVTDVDGVDRSWFRHRVRYWPPARPPIPVADPRPDVFLGANNWLIHAEETSTQPVLRRRCAELLAELEPLPPLQRRIAEFRARYFRSTMIGVHLRRGDFLRLRPDVSGNTREALGAVDRFLAAAPDAGILLCTDDGAMDPDTGQVRWEGVRDVARARYGTRVMSITPRSLDRRTVEGVQDALVELWLLRATQMVVGTSGSSFSEVATFGREVRQAHVGGGLPGYRLGERVLRLIGAHWLVCHLFRVTHGYDQPFLIARKRLTVSARRWVKRRRAQTRARCAAWWSAARSRRLGGRGFWRLG